MDCNISDMFFGNFNACHSDCFDFFDVLQEVLFLYR